MATLNLCSFLGRLGRDPETTKTLTGVAVAKFTLALRQPVERLNTWHKE